MTADPLRFEEAANGVGGGDGGGGGGGGDPDCATVVLVVETRPAAWKLVRAKSPEATLSAICGQIKVFVNAFLSLHHRNRLVCLAEHSDACHFVYGGRPAAAEAQALDLDSRDAGSIVAEAIAALVRTTLRAPHADSLHSKRFAQALSMALCHLNRQLKQDSDPALLLDPQRHSPSPDESPSPSASTSRPSRYRILSLRVSPDPPEQYIPIMNCIFAAQRCNILIDACQIGQGDSSFLQQACHLTGGQYLRPARLGALLQYMLAVFAVDAETRDCLSQPEASTVDFRASCFCHRRPVDIGFVCSVCLSIFCEEPGACATCGARFDG